MSQNLRDRVSKTELSLLKCCIVQKPSYAILYCTVRNPLNRFVYWHIFLEQSINTEYSALLSSRSASLSIKPPIPTPRDNIASPCLIGRHWITYLNSCLLGFAPFWTAISFVVMLVGWLVLLAFFVLFCFALLCFLYF